MYWWLKERNGIRWDGGNERVHSKEETGSAARFLMVPRIGLGIGEQDPVSWLLQGWGEAGEGVMKDRKNNANHLLE